MQGKSPSIGLRAALAIFAATVFVPSTWAATQEKILHTFNNNGTDGAVPLAGLIFDAAGNLYGTTSRGGTGSCFYSGSGCGTVFKLSPNGGGGWTEQVLHYFSNNGTDGFQPLAGLIIDAAGNLYGTTATGGTHPGGTVFELTPAQGGNWTEKVLYNFCSQTNCTDGAGPLAGLIFDAAGNLYGTTSAGGTYQDFGTVFELMPTKGGGWTEQVLHSFAPGTDGANPSAGLIFDAAGNLYGTTSYGGTYTCDGTSCGTVFEVSPKAGGGWTEQVLYNFGNGTDGSIRCRRQSVRHHQLRRHLLQRDGVRVDDASQDRHDYHPKLLCQSVHRG